MNTNARNEITGTVHSAHTDAAGFIVQDCGIRANQTVSLTPTTAAKTCRKCPAKTTTKATPAPRKVSSGPTVWGIYNAAGDLVAFRSTRKEALAAIAHLGGELTTRKA